MEVMMLPVVVEWKCYSCGTDNKFDKGEIQIEYDDSITENRDEYISGKIKEKMTFLKGEVEKGNYSPLQIKCFCMECGKGEPWTSGEVGVDSAVDKPKISVWSPKKSAFVALEKKSTSSAIYEDEPVGDVVKNRIVKPVGRGIRRVASIFLILLAGAIGKSCAHAMLGNSSSSTSSVNSDITISSSYEDSDDDNSYSTDGNGIADGSIMDDAKYSFGTAYDDIFRSEGLENKEEGVDYTVYTGGNYPKELDVINHVTSLSGTASYYYFDENDLLIIEETDTAYSGNFTSQLFLSKVEDYKEELGSPYLESYSFDTETVGADADEQIKSSSDSTIVEWRDDENVLILTIAEKNGGLLWIAEVRLQQEYLDW